MTDLDQYLDWHKQSRLVDRAKLILFFLPFVLLVPFIWEKLTNPWNFWQFVQEDGPVEWATALVYILAAPLALLLSVRFRKQGQILYAALIAGLGVVMFFVGMEEISWGQRVLGIETPAALAEANLQEETNLHNLFLPTTLQTGFLLIGLYGTIANHIMPRVLKPIFGKDAQGLATLVSPPNFLKPYFFLTFAVQLLFIVSPWLEGAFGPAWGFAHKPDAGYFLLGRDREVVELIIALGFFLFTCWLLFLQRTGEWDDLTESPEADEGDALESAV